MATRHRPRKLVDVVTDQTARLYPPDLPFRLTGSQAKTAFALRKNIEDTICGDAPRKLVDYTTGDGITHKVWLAEKPENLNCTGFATLTVGDYHCATHGKQIPEVQNLCPQCREKMKFVQIFDAAEASRRFNNLNRKFLPTLFEKAVAVTERHANKAIHFHLVGILLGRPDIRTGLDFDAVGKRDYRSASDELRAIWETMRDVLPRYGFGRSELLPIKKTGEAVAAYVAKYVEKNIYNRLKEDKGKKLVRYLGFKKTQLKPNEFGWGSKRATAWRCKAREVAALVGIEEPEQAKEVLGPRWAFTLTRIIQAVSDAAVPFMVWDWKERELVRGELEKKAGRAWCAPQDKPKLFMLAGETFTARELAEMRN